MKRHVNLEVIPEAKRLSGAVLLSASRCKYTPTMEKKPRSHPERLSLFKEGAFTLTFIDTEHCMFLPKARKSPMEALPKFATETFLDEFSVAPELAKEIKFYDFDLSCAFEFPKTADLKELESLCDSLAIEGISASIKITSTVFGPMVEITKQRKDLETWLEEQISYAKPR